MSRGMLFWLLCMGGGAALVMIGAILGPGVANLVPGTVSMMFSVFGVVMTMFPAISIIGQVKRARLFPFLGGTKDDEQITIFTDVRNRLIPTIMNTKHEGILHKREMGIIEDKGTPLTWADTGIPVSISLQKCGVTVNLKEAQYQNKLEQNKGLEDYETAIKRFLGPASYAEFAKKFRGTTEPQYEEISKELDYLLKQQPNDPLAEKVCGETVDFKHFLNWLKYAYHPLSAENAVDSEILTARRESMAYKEASKVGGYGKLILVVLIGVGIFLVIISTIGPNLGGLLGGK